jgi:hypothetical protein
VNSAFIDAASTRGAIIIVIAIVVTIDTLIDPILPDRVDLLVGAVHSLFT